MHNNQNAPLYRQTGNSRKFSGNLLVRNILNLVFIIMAVITIIGIALHLGKDETPTWCYLLGVVAVIIKMCESMLRMPGFHRSGNQRMHQRTKK